MKQKMLLLISGFIILSFNLNCEELKKEKKGLIQIKKDILKKIITLESLEEMFENIKKQTKWDTTKPLLWGYFFTNSNPKLLEMARDVLVKKGYRYVDIYLSDKDNPDDNDMWWLHIEKEEIHTPQSLDKRNDDLYNFANDFGLDSYDGMDVGPIKK